MSQWETGAMSLIAGGEPATEKLSAIRSEGMLCGAALRSHLVHTLYNVLRSTRKLCQHLPR